MRHKENATNIENSNYNQRKIADLTISEFSVIFEKIQTAAIAKALKSVVPTTDPDEHVYLTTKEAANLLGLSKQTIFSKKSKMLLEFYGQGRIQRTTLAAIKRYLKKFGTPLSRLRTSSNGSKINVV